MFMNPHTEDLISKHEVIKLVGWEEIEISKRIYFKEVIPFFFLLKKNSDVHLCFS